MSNLNPCVLCKLKVDTHKNKKCRCRCGWTITKRLMKFVQVATLVGVEPIVDLGRKYLCQKCFRDIESHIKLSKKLNTADVAVCTPTLYVCVVIIIIIATAIIAFH